MTAPGTSAATRPAPSTPAGPDSSVPAEQDSATPADPCSRPPAAVGVWPVLRGWPRSREHALLELDTAAGSRGAQWFARRTDLQAAAADIPGGEVQGPVLLHPQGADHRLPAMAARIGAGEQIVVHRPGRRAVLRGPGPAAPFTKVTRKRRAAGAVQRHRAVAEVLGPSARLARVLDAGPDWFSLSALPGRTLLDLGADRHVPAHLLAAGWAALGSALAHLHTAGPQPPAGIEADHDARAEHATTMRWLDPVLHWQLLPAVDRPEIEGLLSPLTGQSPAEAGLLHRDLHDQQILFDVDNRAGQVGLLDLDAAAWGEAALDVANVLTHLELRVRQQLLSAHRAAIAEQAFLTGLEPSATTMARVHAYRTAARLRLCAVYALRPRWRSLATRWFTEIHYWGAAPASRW